MNLLILIGKIAFFAFLIGIIVGTIWPRRARAVCATYFSIIAVLVIFSELQSETSILRGGSLYQFLYRTGINGFYSAIIAILAILGFYLGSMIRSAVNEKSGK